MIPKALQEALATRQAYKRVFNSEDGRRVLNDLIKRYVTSSPAALTSKATLINVGMQKAVQWICWKTFSNDKEFEKAVRESYETTNQEQE